VVSERGAPNFVRSDNGPAVVSKALMSWIVARDIGTALIELGQHDFGPIFVVPNSTRSIPRVDNETRRVD
jgi:hypothetical protein